MFKRNYVIENKVKDVASSWKKGLATSASTIVYILSTNMFLYFVVVQETQVKFNVN